jgi:cell division protein FtsQ
MKKFYKIFSLTLIFLILSTYNHREFKESKEDKYSLFKIKKIEILNNLLITKDEINKQLKNLYNKNIFLIKAKDVEDPLKDLDFYKRVEVKKKYPNILIIKIFETQPIALIFKKKNKYLINSASNLISINPDINIAELPSIFGEDSENNFIYFFNQLKKNKFDYTKIKNFYYFQIVRWDIQLLDGKIIKYPSKNTNEAIKKSIELLNHKDFKNYKIIDLRVNGKVIVE